MKPIAFSAFVASLLLATAALADDKIVKLGQLDDQSSLYADSGGPGSVIAVNMAVEDSGLRDKGWTISNLSADDTPASVPAAIPGAPAAEPSAATALVTPSAAMAKARAEPTAPLKTTAWIKFGVGSPRDDIQACVAALGPGNEPDTVRQTVTPALLGCMRAKGWRGL